MIPLEDNFADVLGKALRGRNLDQAAAARAAKLDPAAVARLLAGDFEEDATRALASALQLSPEALVRLARREHHPMVPCPESMFVATTPFDGMTVNAYILWDGTNRDAAIFDTGADPAPLLDAVARFDLNVIAIFLTHSHADHIRALTALKSELGVEAWSSDAEPVPGTRTFRPGDLFNAGHHFIRTRLTPGHSPGGTSFIIEGHAIRAAIVGDALFAGSVGGVRGDYTEALATIRREILSLPEATILCPGHGPLTTVECEKAGNPFFAA
jgi:glyoxylase-like metal-dependent hydrolase (beta-lactamase superfamily II)